MGWSGGSEIFEGVMKTLDSLLDLDDSEKYDVIWELIPLFESHDCDTLYEVNDPVVQEVLAEMYPKDE